MQPHLESRFKTDRYSNTISTMYILICLFGYSLLVSCNTDNTYREVQGSSIDTISIQNQYSIIRLNDEALQNLCEIGFPVLLDSNIIIVNDLVANNVQIIDTEEQKSAVIIANGEGPGEVLHPQSLQLDSSGNLVIADDTKRLIMWFKVSGEHLTSVPYPDDCFSIQRILVADERCLYLSMFSNVYENDTPVFESSITHFDTLYRSTRDLYKLSWQIPSTSYYSEWWLLEGYGTNTGIIYICSDATQYAIDAVDTSAVVVHTINNDRYGRIEKSQAEIELEREEFLGFATRNPNASYYGDFEPLPYKRIIRVSGLDRNGLLWVQTFQSDSMLTFDIWDKTELVGYAYYPWNMVDTPIFASIFGDQILVFSTEESFDICMDIMVNDV